MLDGGLLPVSLRTSAAVAGAFLIGAYVIFGSPTDVTKKRRRKKDFIPGLANIGNSCFLNSLVQSLASCSTFISWLSSKHSLSAPPLVSALHNLLRVLNNEDGWEGDACASQVLGALRGHGWVISSEEQDTHELFHVLTSTIDDELTTATSIPSLLDVAWVNIACLGSLQDGVAMKADSWEQSSTKLKKVTIKNKMGIKDCFLASIQGDSVFSKLNGKLMEDWDGEHSVLRNGTETNSKLTVGVGKGLSGEGTGQGCDNVTCVEDSDQQNYVGIKIKNRDCNSTVDEKNDEHEEKKTSESSLQDGCNIEGNLRELSPQRQVTKSLLVDNDNSEVHKAGYTSNRKPPGRLITTVCQGSDNFGWRFRGDQQDIPFRGYLASQLQCTFCGHKNPAQWTSFESMSLSLPPVPWGDVALTELLDAYVTPEKVTDVSCDGCSRRARSLVKTTFTKQLTIGKLPDCLCFHIKRTVWLKNGSAIKRRDHLTFPEFLVMDPYTYTTSITSQGNQKTSVLSQEYNGASSIASTLETRYQHSLSSIKSQGSSASHHQPSTLVHLTRVRFEQLYHLKAVIVHVGDVFCGHFVTYRCGPIASCIKNKWFYTSDLLVREATLEEVRQANAYMILYEKVT